MKNFIKKRRELKKFKLIVKENKNFLENGKYEITYFGKKICYINNPTNRNFLDKNKNHLDRNNKNNKIVKIMKTIIKKTLLKEKLNIKNNIKSNFQGSLMMITKDEDLKIFNLEYETVINVLRNEEKYNRIKLGYCTLKDYINTTITYFDEKEKVLVENFINFKSYSILDRKEKDFMIENLFTNYFHYFNAYHNYNYEIVNTYSLLSDFLKAKPDQELQKAFQEIILKQNIETFPKIILHGDMCFYNMLLLNEEVYYIDFEHSDKYVFFYDFMNIFFVEFNNENESFLRDYLSGKYDLYFKEAFQNFNIEFKVDERKLYFILFLLERVLLDKKNDYILKFSEKYKYKIFRILNYLEDYSEK